MDESFWMEESSIYGRNDDKEAIIERLLSLDSANGKGLLEVIPIVGMGGVGKTLLARLVYNDSRVQDWFDVKAWVCAAAKFDLLKVAKDILEEVSSKSCDANTTYNDVLVELKGKLEGKIFLLVLDDVWNDNKEEWDFLLNHLECARSKIIVTTRNASVASAMGCSRPHVVSELSNDECWSLFAKHAFHDDYCSTANYSRLEIIGREIVRKCQGLPLIVKMVGDLLCSKKDIEEWKRISNNIEDCSNYDIFMILKLSHVDLLFHLKQCLAYSIKSPKDYDFVKEKLVLLWMEESLIPPKENKRKKEEDNTRYFHDLGSAEIVIHDQDIPIRDSSKFWQFPKDNEVIFDCGITVTYLILEISLVILDQIASPKKPNFALIALVVSLIGMFICILELAYKGQKKPITLKRQGIRCLACWLCFPSSDHNPYTYIDVFSLVSAISQFIFACIAYSYLYRGAQNPIKVSFAPIIFIICMALSKLFKKPNETSLPIRRNA